MSDYTKTLPIRIQGVLLTATATVLGHFLWSDLGVLVVTGLLLASALAAIFYYLGAKRKDTK